MDGTDGASARAHPRRARWLSEGVLSFACVDAVYLRMSVRLFVVSIVCRHFSRVSSRSLYDYDRSELSSALLRPCHTQVERAPSVYSATATSIALTNNASSVYYLVQQVYPGQVMWRQRWRKWLPLFQPIRSYPANATKTDDFLFLLHSTKEAFNEIFV